MLALLIDPAPWIVEHPRVPEIPMQILIERNQNPCRGSPRQGDYIYIVRGAKARVDKCALLFFYL
jgi:hypothetical protein